jgi:arsenical pump membrane protein
VRSVVRDRLRLWHVVLVAIVALLATGQLGGRDFADAGRVLWRPVVTIAAIMVLTAAAGRLGVVQRVALTITPWAHGSPRGLLSVVFALGLGTSAVLNNDSAVLLVVPIVVTLVRQLYPGRNDVIAWFALVVFMAAGVAPLMVSNPMNLIVAEYAGMSFNSYAARMLPVAVAGWVVAFGVLHIAGGAVLATMGPPTSPATTRPRWTAAQVRALALVVGILIAYPIASYLGIDVWAVAVGGAALAAMLCARHGAGSYADIVRRDIAWEVLVFLAGVFVVAIGLRNAGVVDALERLYDGANLAVMGTTSAVGSALINNHPMGLLNLLAIDPTPGGDLQPILAALVGGDLGPRLLPTGSLAGVLLFATLRRLDVRLSIRRFCAIGALVTIPSLAASLVVLALTT